MQKIPCLGQLPKLWLRIQVDLWISKFSCMQYLTTKDRVSQQKKKTKRTEEPRTSSLPRIAIHFKLNNHGANTVNEEIIS
uniref:Uncharacterized protein n=1 Tax=Rhizophora mucronata TaxID=61149 RepID=A0A2P2PJI9_RHIMU